MALLERDLVAGVEAAAQGPTHRKFTRDEYHAMDRAGILQPDEKTELVDGEVYIMSPIGSAHLFSVYKLGKALERNDSTDHFVLPGSPIILSDLSEPQPDIIVLRGSIGDYEDVLPTVRDALLVVEVSVSTLGFDRGRKMTVYALASIPEYWIVNVRGRRVELHRDPQPDGTYASVSIVNEAGNISPLFAGDVSIEVSSILPSRKTDQSD